MNNKTTITILLALTLSAAACLPHEKAPDATPRERVGTQSTNYGLSPGTRAPDANLIDPDGHPQRLSDAMGKHATAIVFYRGGWCPPCNFQVHELAKHNAEFTSRGVNVVAISVDKPDYAKKTIEEYGVPFTVLSDPELEAHRAFRVVDHVGGVTSTMLSGMGVSLSERSGHDHHDVAVPSIFVVDREGVVRWAHADTDYSVRPQLADVLAAIDGLHLPGGAP